MIRYSKETYCLLQKLYRNEAVNRHMFSADALRNLYNDKYIMNSSDFHNENVFITDKGKAYVEYHRAENFKYYFSVVLNGMLSVIAVAVSIIGLLK